MQLHSEVLGVKTSISELWKDTDQPITKSYSSKYCEAFETRMYLSDEWYSDGQANLPVSWGCYASPWMQTNAWGTILVAEMFAFRSPLPLLLLLILCNNISVYRVLLSSGFCFSFSNWRNCQEMEKEKEWRHQSISILPQPLSALDNVFNPG